MAEPSSPSRLGTSGPGNKASAPARGRARFCHRSEEHTSELQSRLHLVCRLLLEKKKKKLSAAVLLQEWIDEQTSITSITDSNHQISEIIAEERFRLRNIINRRWTDPLYTMTIM